MVGGASHGAGTAVAVAVAVAGVGVHHGGAAVLVVAQPLLDGADVVAAFELVGRDGVADSDRTRRGNDDRIRTPMTPVTTLKTRSGL